MRILRNVFLSIQNIFHVFENKLNILNESVQFVVVRDWKA